ncbi:MAG: DNA mismatch repair protein MutS [Clostridia bacterium]|nr:DNA mismatch repair protein MutS [Clostridia bacterium]
MMDQYLEIKEENNDAFLFYRLGDFYEMFFEDAIRASKLLDLTLTGRDCGKEERAPMCGVPFHSAEAYINRLVSMGFKVAVCEQLEDPAGAKGLVKRGIVRRITPGTVVDDGALESTKNNFICCIYSASSAAGLCFADLSAGVVKATSFNGEDLSGAIINELAVFEPREVVLNSTDADVRELQRYIKEREIFLARQRNPLSYEKTEADLLSQFGADSLESLGINGSPELVMAVGMLFQYLNETAMCEYSHMKKLECYTNKQYMALPYVTRRSLELTETMVSRDRRGSLLGVIDCTKTAAGGRLMRSWIEQPLLSISKIIRRQNAVANLASDTVMRSEIRTALDGVYDLERLMGSIAYGSSNAKTLYALATSASMIPAIKAALAGSTSEELTALNSEISDLADLREVIDRAIDPNAPITLHDAGMIKPGYNEELDRLTYVAKNGRTLMAEMEAREKAETGIKGLKISYNRVFGYYIEVSKLYSDQVPDRYIRKQTISNSERYFTTELKELETTILEAQDRINTLEYELFCEIRELVRAQTDIIMTTAAALARLDVLSALAETAVKRKYVRPDVDISGEIKIRMGRHPVVEAILKDTVFVPNDTELDCSGNRLAIITGPNMAGKSTYMRQVALIVIMAQMGGFVPAESAKLGVVDKIFTRIGASDELSAGKSTFMVEMSEAADILRSATKDSLIILDEIGRGTSTYDGMSIAKAMLEYIASKRLLGAKTLFATHYHELTVLEGEIEGVKNYNIVVKKRGEEIIFLRKIVRGGADNSYGVEVARLAGLPARLISRAKEILSELESGRYDHDRPSEQLQDSGEEQISLSSGLYEELAKELADVQADTLTPIEALNLLYKFSNKAKQIV